VLEKIAKIRKHVGKNKWTVYSEKGKSMGTYNSESAAKKRLRQIEYFKHLKKNDILEPNFHGEKPSFLDVEVKTSFDENYMENNMNRELLKLAKELKNMKKNDEAKDVADLAKSVQTSSSETTFVKDIENAENIEDDFHYIHDKSSLGGLTAMLSYLRAMQAWFHGAHHVTGGEGFAGDHSELYTRIYEAMIEDYDSAAEKAIGLSEEKTACPLKVMDHANKIISRLTSPCDLTAVEIARHGYSLIMRYLKFLDHLYSSLDKDGSLTLGLDDFIMSMANDYETFAYLLKQRSSDYKSGDKSCEV